MIRKITVQLVGLRSRKSKRDLKNVQLVFQTQVVLILVVQITHTIQERVNMYQIVQSLITVQIMNVRKDTKNIRKNQV
jgi:hypothetical protein